MARQSKTQNLSVADRIDERSFGEAMWKSVKGANSTMPAPVHSVMGDTARAQREAQAAARANGQRVTDADDRRRRLTPGTGAAGRAPRHSRPACPARVEPVHPLPSVG